MRARFRVQEQVEGIERRKKTFVSFELRSVAVGELLACLQTKRNWNLTQTEIEENGNYETATPQKRANHS